MQQRLSTADRPIKSLLCRRPTDLPAFRQSAGSDRQIVTRSQLVSVSWFAESVGLARVRGQILGRLRLRVRRPGAVRSIRGAIGWDRSSDAAGVADGVVQDLPEGPCHLGLIDRQLAECIAPPQLIGQDEPWVLGI